MRRKTLSFLIGIVILGGLVIAALIYFKSASGFMGRGSVILVLDDFEDLNEENISSSVDFGSGNNSEISVGVSRDIKFSGEKSLKVEYKSAPGGYMWLARGYDLDVEGASKWKIQPQRIDWGRYKAITFYFYGEAKGAQIAFDIRDNGKEYWRFMIKDTTVGWRKISCPLNEFFVRSDWQPEDAVKNGVLDFPIKSFQFEPRTPGESVIYIDRVELSS